MTYPYSPNEILLMDGASTPPKDLIIGPGTAYTMAGTPATATVLGATAPTIAAGSYTSCSIANPLTAGSALTVMCAVTTAWAGNDGVTHSFIGMTAVGAGNNIVLMKHSSNGIRWYCLDNAGAAKGIATAALNATTWAAGTHILIVTRSASGAAWAAYLDGNTLSVGTDYGTGAESSIGASLYVGVNNLSGAPVSGSLLTAIWSRVLTSTEITALSSITAWSTLTTPVATGGRRRRSKAILGGG